MNKWLGISAALVVLAAPVTWQVISGQRQDTAVTNGPVETPDIRALRAELASLRGEVETLRARVDGLDSRTAVSQVPSPLPLTTTPSAAARAPEADTLQDRFAQVVLIAGRRSANDGLTVASSSFLRQTFGLPRTDLNDQCQSITNPQLRGLIKTENVGPIRARMLAPALSSLRRVFTDVQEFEPELYERIASSGSLCVRLIRGSTIAASAHAYGLAVDLNIDGKLDNFADGKTQLGLILLADFFKREGWIWGAGFGREDSMHFEVSREKITEWRGLGLL